MKDVEEYSQMGFDKIKNVSLLSNDDYDNVKELSTELQRVFEVKQLWRTETEMRYSVLDDVRFPTIAAKYWQCIREQDVFFSNLIHLSCDYEEREGELDLLRIDIDQLKPGDIKSKANAKIINAKIKRLQFVLMDMRIQGRNRVREIKLWEQLKEELKGQAEFDINDVNVHQKDIVCPVICVIN